jgi:exopolysaccharide production protein ExoZ
MIDGNPRHRVAYIDGLRAIAVLSVVMFHTAKYSGMAATAPLALLFRSASHGVDLFFVLSGFCLSYPTLARVRRDNDTKFGLATFAARRIVRIIPAYWIAIAVIAVFGIILTQLHVQLPLAMPQHGFSALDVGMQALFIDRGAQLLNGSFWTLPIEFRWYFLFPFFLWLWVKSPKAFLAVMIALFGLLAVPAHRADLIALPAFLLGIVAAALTVNRIRLGFWPAIVTVVSVVAAVATLGNAGWDYTPNPLWYAAAFAFVMAVSTHDLAARALSVRILATVGLASYSIYLVHEPAIAFLEEHSVGPALAGSIGIVLGFAFWAIAERPFVETSLRERLIAQLEPVFAKWMPRLRIPVRLRMSAEPRLRRAD